jgi:hypothetical protein
MMALYMCFLTLTVIVCPHRIEFRAPKALLLTQWTEDGFGKLWRREVSLISLLN